MNFYHKKSGKDIVLLKAPWWVEGILHTHKWDSSMWRGLCWHFPVFSYVQAFLGEILNSIQLFRVCFVFFLLLLLLKKLTLYQLNVDRKKNLSTSENGVLCGFINILSKALYNLFCVTCYSLYPSTALYWSKMNLYSETSSGWG